MQTSADGSQVYARATPRLKALVRDVIVQATILLCLIVPFALFENQRLLGILAPVCLAAFVLYEPVLVALRGATFGHRWMNLRIVRARDFGRVSFPRALLRMVVKALFGIPAFIAMYFTVRHQALHDLVAGTVVVPYDSRVVRREWFEPARPEQSAVTLPGAFQRLLVILVHWVVLFGLTVFAAVLLLPYECFEEGERCPSAADSLFDILILLFMVGIMVIGLAGWKGLLWGLNAKLARSRAHEQQSADPLNGMLLELHEKHLTVAAARSTDRRASRAPDHDDRGPPASRQP